MSGVACRHELNRYRHLCIIIVETRPLMTATVQKWGNSLAIRLPKGVAGEAHLKQGTTVQLEPTENGLLIKPARQPLRPTLRALLAQCKGPNPHAPADFGQPVGTEIW